MKDKLHFTSLLIACMLFVGCNPKSDVYKATDFGAIANGKTVNTEAIQRAIDACNEGGGGTVILDKGDYVSGTLLLKDKVTLHIAEDAQLIGSSNPLDYQSIDTFTDATGQKRGNCLIGAKNATNIAVTGKGTIDGNGEAFLAKNIKAKIKELNLAQTEGFGSNRPFLLRFVNSSQIKVQDVHLRQPAAWTCHFYQSNDILVENVSIYSHAHKNNDGIDLDSSYDAIIKNCDINTGDDAICIKTTSPKPTYNVQVSDCKLRSDWGSIKFGTESMGDMYNIDITNCQIYDTKGGGIKVLSVDGANIHDVTIDGIQMDRVDMPIFIRLGERLRTYRNAEKQEVGSITDVIIKNVKGSARALDSSRVNPPSGILMTGTPNHKIGKILLENIELELPGGGIEEHTMATVAEDETRYPEFSFFTVLPAYGLYGRHIENLQTNNVVFTLNGTDKRESQVLVDTHTTLSE
ncbi:glycoside hydrolase family 28 protein [Zobellia galactanivorans]|uniref:Polygalacturonase, family GH28 n=1 Tax=Zobellia galactanivorans (strain DSM 12802 / CCUG 47099 / CIP 106680 / NCIMB 13871 / Dsij) TaxID=63186 RepID=G0L8Q8_ZOBGA|nr:glycosyl hydrolase family 28 protein [Zobellia galactanivorans]MBU3024281.1 right-handed parallel beta-helix repeat-containing protein [Zobellia galactanivorans]CAZ97769.1 Polygalacturonase, family GH28 [Zobellia galactanivorans]